MFENIQAILFDIDGTLLTDKIKMLPQTMKALNLLHERGIKLGLASGRRVDQMQSKGNDWNLESDFDIMIGLNGGQLWDKDSGELLSFYPMQPEQIKAAYELLKDFDCNIYTYNIGKTLYSRMDELTNQAMRMFGAREYTVVKNPEELWAESSPKILMRCHYEESLKIEAFMKTHKIPGVQLIRTQSTVLELQDERLDKGNALKLYSQRSGIPIEDIMACGDTSNDNGMIEAAGVGVCMKNGTEDTKAVADYITEYTNNEDGMGKWLLKHVLNVTY